MTTSSGRGDAVGAVSTKRYQARGDPSTSFSGSTPSDVDTPFALRSPKALRQFTGDTATVTDMTALVRTTERRLIPSNPNGYLRIVSAPGETQTLRSELGGDPAALTRGRGRVLLRLLHVTDTHVMDAGSPARSDWVEARATEKKWHPLLHMARPHDLLANWGAAAFSAAINASADDGTGAVVFTGDNTDNAQRNELEAFIALTRGGSFAFPYEGPQRSSWADDSRSNDPIHHTTSGLWPFWLPDGGRPDRFHTEFGFPLVNGLIDAASAPISSPGVGMAWLAALGNHDVMRQGTVFTTPEVERIAVGSWRALGGPVGFDPADPLAAYLEDPTAFSNGQPRFEVSPDPRRRAVTSSEFIRALGNSGTTHGALRDEGSTDFVHDTEHVRIIVLDTNHPTGHYQGSVGLAQLTWLDDRLREAQDRPVVVASHHGSVSLDNTYENPDPTDRRLAADLEAVLLRYGNVVVWLAGHRHVHRIRPLSSPVTGLAGLWEITTSSTIDWPCQIRAVEIVAGDDGSIGVHTEVLDHDAIEARVDVLDATSLAAWHREIALNSDRAGGRSGREGTPSDRNAYLARP